MRMIRDRQRSTPKAGTTLRPDAAVDLVVSKGPKPVQLRDWVGKDADAGSPSLIEAVRNARRPDGRPAWTPLVAVSMMVFFVLACQCMSTVAIVRRETNSWRWPLFMVAYMLVIAYVASFVTYQGGKFLGLS